MIDFFKEEELEVVEEAIDASELVATVERMVEEYTTRNRRFGGR